MNLLAIAVGIKQKEVVNQIVKKVMLFRHMLCSFATSSFSPRSFGYQIVGYMLVHIHFRYLLLLQFLENNFVVMLFHYDGIVDEWNQLQWSSQVIHVSATNQTKW